MTWKTSNIFEKEFQSDKIIFYLKNIKKIRLVPNKSATGLNSIVHDSIKTVSFIDPTVEEIFKQIIYDVVQDRFELNNNYNPNFYLNHEELIDFKNLIQEKLDKLDLPTKRRKIEQKNFYKNLSNQIKKGISLGLQREELVTLYDEALVEKVIKS